jgi:hypothetical protein
MAAGALLSIAAVAIGCSSLTAGPSKIVLNENVCANVRFLNMKLNKTNRMVVDNRKFTEGQTNLTVKLDKFPVIVQGEVPAGSVIGDKVSTIIVRANPGEQSTVDLVPTFTGSYTGTCTVAIAQGTGLRTQQQDITFQIK